MKRARLVVLAIMLGMMGCGDEDPVGPGQDGSFELTVTGALEATTAGPAWFGSDVDPEAGERWVLLLGDGGGDGHMVVAGRPGITRPTAGTYPLTAPDEANPGWTLVHLVTDAEELLGMFVADQGTVTLTSSSSGEVAGQLNFRAVDLLTGGSDTVFVTGSFVARPAPATLESMTEVGLGR